MNRGLRCTSIWTRGVSLMQRKLWISPALMTASIAVARSSGLLATLNAAEVFQHAHLHAPLAGRGHRHIIHELPY